jgi:hypothetical protein
MSTEKELSDARKRLYGRGLPEEALNDLTTMILAIAREEIAARETRPLAFDAPSPRGAAHGDTAGLGAGIFGERPVPTPVAPETGGATTAPVIIGYTNYRGEYAERRIIPSHIWFGKTEWHPEPQWLLHALDLDKNATRDFALKDIGNDFAAAEVIRAQRLAMRATPTPVAPETEDEPEREAHDRIGELFSTPVAPETGEELLPCPFCGSHAKLFAVAARRMAMDCPDAVVECAECHVDICKDTDAEAVEAWNRRTQAATIADLKRERDEARANLDRENFWFKQAASGETANRERYEKAEAALAALRERVGNIGAELKSSTERMTGSLTPWTILWDIAAQARKHSLALLTETGDNEAIVPDHRQ